MMVKNNTPNPVLAGKSGKYAGSHFKVEVDDFSVGRAPGSTLVLDQKTISTEHAAIRRTANGYNLIDLNSTNGTFVNGRKINSIFLNNKDVIRFDNLEFVFHDNSLPGYIDPETRLPANRPAFSGKPVSGKPPANAVRNTKKRNGKSRFENGGYNLFGFIAGVAAAWLIIFIAVFTTSAYQAGSHRSTNELVREMGNIPYMHTHFYYEVVSTEEIRRTAVLALGILIGIVFGTIVFRLLSRYSASNTALLFTSGYYCIVLFLHLLSHRFSLDNLTNAALRITGLQIDGFTAVIAVYLYGMALVWFFSMITGFMIRK